MAPKLSLDELRAARPDLSFALYAMTPGQPVTLEIYHDGHVYPFTGATVTEAILSAFPPTPTEETVHKWECPRCHLHYDSPNHLCPATPDTSIFD